MNAREIIDTARQRHPAFTEVRIPTKTLLPALSDIQRRVVSRTIEVDEDAVHTEHQVVLPLADFEAGYALPGFHRVRAVVAGRSDGSTLPLEIIPAGNRNARNTPAAAVWVVGGRLYLPGTAASWSNYTGLAVSIVPVAADFDTATDLATQDSVLDIIARPVLAAELALFMGRRIGKVPDDTAPVRVSELQQEAADAMNEYLHAVRSRGAKTFRIMDVFP